MYKSNKSLLHFSEDIPIVCSRTVNLYSLWFLFSFEQAVCVVCPEGASMWHDCATLLVSERTPPDLVSRLSKVSVSCIVSATDLRLLCDVYVTIASEL